MHQLIVLDKVFVHVVALKQLLAAMAVVQQIHSWK